MFKLLLVFSVGILFLCTANGAQTPLQTAKKVASKKVVSEKPEKIEQKICPVMGGKINPDLYYEYKNTRIYVCCPGCIPIIKKDPDKYLKKVKAQIAAAKQKAAAAEKKGKKSSK